MICTIKMNTEEDVIRVSEIAANAGIDMAVCSGNSSIDPRSTLGLFAFMGKEVTLVAPDGLNPKVFARLVKKMKVGV